MYYYVVCRAVRPREPSIWHSGFRSDAIFRCLKPGPAPGLACSSTRSSTRSSARSCTHGRPPCTLLMSASALTRRSLATGQSIALVTIVARAVTLPLLLQSLGFLVETSGLSEEDCPAGTSVANGDGFPLFPVPLPLHLFSLCHDCLARYQVRGRAIH